MTIHEDIRARLDDMPLEELLEALALISGLAAHDDMEHTLAALDNIKAQLQRQVTVQ